MITKIEKPVKWLTKELKTLNDDFENGKISIYVYSCKYNNAFKIAQKKENKLFKEFKNKF